MHKQEKQSKWDVVMQFLDSSQIRERRREIGALVVSV